ncbi:hypothetical protein IAQ61_003125 [Plenodomus lingam]|uniref:uncharacterized protein n=1 Tax=Leptosphaeria maculans TaxID=5022 RepID=UPI00332DA1DE|nr:hypothetical protein IAQ61_003125 [Plenodomus lingam]
MVFVVVDPGTRDTASKVAAGWGWGCGLGVEKAWGFFFVVLIGLGVCLVWFGGIVGGVLDAWVEMEWTDDIRGVDAVDQLMPVDFDFRLGTVPVLTPTVG